jgi:hypothetical protein
MNIVFIIVGVLEYRKERFLFWVCGIFISYFFFFFFFSLGLLFGNIFLYFFFGFL